jgi:hypothetical protein
MGNLKIEKMKKLLLICTTMLSVLANGQTSIYRPFPDSNAVWNINFYSGCMIGTDQEFYSITFSGDTTINSLTYHKLFSPFVQSFISGGCNVTHTTGYKGAIRQDTTNKKVFYVPPTDLNEQLLYDFTLQVGDTVKGFLESFAFQPDVVLSIDSVLVGDNYHKRWIINTCYNIYLIEGIGSTFGLIELSPGCITDYDGYTITCFQQNGQSIYPDTTSNCQLITSIYSIDPNSSKVKVFPNPSNGLITVDFEQPSNIREIKVTDLLGNIVKQQKTFNNKKIYIDNLPSGVYILTIFDKDNKTINEKIISSP